MKSGRRWAMAGVLALAAVARWGGGAFVERQLDAKNRENAAASPDERAARRAIAAYSDDPRFLFPDSHDFHAAAANLRARGEHVDQYHRRAWRTPLYSLALAGWMAAGGRDDAGGCRHLNRLFDLVNVWLVYALARRFAAAAYAGRRRRPPAWVAPAAALLYALDPWSAYFSNLLLADTLGNTATLAALLAAAAWQDIGRTTPERRRWPYMASALATGAAAGAAVLAKPGLSFLGAFLVAFAFFWLWRRRGDPLAQGDPADFAHEADGAAPGRVVCLRRRFLMSAPLVAVGWALVLAPWWVRNYRWFGAFVPFSTMGGFTLWESLGPRAGGGANFGTVDMPDEWRVKTAIVHEGREVYAFRFLDMARFAERHASPSREASTLVMDILQPESVGDLLEHFFSGPEPLAAFRQWLTRLDSAMPERDAELFPVLLYYLVVPQFHPEPEGLRIYLSEWHGSISGGPGSLIGGSWFSGQGHVCTDYSAVHARLEHDADAFLRLRMRLTAWRLPPFPFSIIQRGIRYANVPFGRALSRVMSDMRVVETALALAPEKARRLWNPFPNFAGARRPGIDFASGAHFLVVYGLGLAGLWWRRARWRALGLLAVPAVYVTAVHAVFLGSVRYRMPAVGGFAVLAALGLAAVAEVVRARRRAEEEEAVGAADAGRTRRKG